MNNRLYSRRPESQPVHGDEPLASAGEFITAVILIVLAVSLLSSCTVEPFIVVTKSGNHITSLGGSVATRSKAKTRSITTAAGDTLTSSGDHDETVVPRMSATGALIGKGIEAIPPVVRAIKP